MNITAIKQKCRQVYRLNNTPFFDLCDISTEYPCFRTDTNDLFDIIQNRPCIDLARIGDGKIDCLSALDERNRISCSDSTMLGFHLQHSDGSCVPYIHLCSADYEHLRDAGNTYDSICFHARNRFQNGTRTTCYYQKDVMCFNDVCIRNARCNGLVECPHGEDEYRCISENTSQIDYRADKKFNQFEKIKLRNYPSSNESNRSRLLPMTKKTKSLPLQSVDELPFLYEMRESMVKSPYKIIRDALPSGTITFENDFLPFICNHGLAVKYHTGDLICLCSPSYYGPRCEFYSDRMTILTHLDLIHYRPSSRLTEVIKVLTTLLFEDRIIDYYEFHVHPQLHTDDNYVKQLIFFQYPRTSAFIKMKNNNRSGTQLYSVRFEAFDLHSNEKIEPIGIWEYPVYFDFLPSFRLSKILRFLSPNTSSLNDPCASNPCGHNGSCQKTINSHRSSYFCSCHSGFSGDHCHSNHPECDEYCSPKSICRPTYRRFISDDQYPLCICPASTFGTSCHLKNNNCRQNPCLNGGSCIVTYHINNTNNYICRCTKRYRGEYCQYPRERVFIRFMLSSNSRVQATDVAAITVSFSDYKIPFLHLDLRHQRVHGNLPSHLELMYDDTLGSNAPTLAVMKIYSSNARGTDPEYYVLYFQTDQNEINITIDLTSENHCPLVQTLWYLLQTNTTTDKAFLLDNSTFNASTAIFSYHHICQAQKNPNRTFSCFRDQNYLCLCESDHYRAECFIYNRSIDQCSLCLANGYCLKGELNMKTDFLCLCPRCYHGSICQYSTELMSFTFDSLIVSDIQNNNLVSCIVYISLVMIVFLFGCFNNACAFLTFVRPIPRKVGVGNYLLLVSIVNQCSLLLLLLKIIHIILGSNGTLFYFEDLNQYLCKILSYLLSVLTRTTYWLTSFVSIERVCVVLFPTSSIVKNPRLALGLSTFAILGVSAMHIHEALHYTVIVDLSYTSVNATVCVTSYVQPWIALYNRVNVLVHYLIPFFIQIISITVIITQTASHRQRTYSGRHQTFIDLLKKQFRTHREHYLTPIIIIFSSLPQTILSFLYACTELKELWQRYTFLTTILLSYLPEILGFILYVLPSKMYSNEFHQTVIGTKLFKQRST